MFENKTLQDISEQDIAKYRATRGKNKDTNRRIEGKGDVMDMLIAGANKIPALAIPSQEEDNKS
ncbi:MAG: hypothetical protein LBH09_06630 [Peptococcaceae bacterium]|jgi:hypothetical protein|nr:hypothetical protein [Peptococcaceae bacterium]